MECSRLQFEFLPNCGLDVHSHIDYDVFKMKYMNLNTLGKLAREVREKAGLNQAEAAKKIGSTQSNVSAAERGSGTRYISVAIGIIEKIGNQPLEGPFYAVSEESAEYNARKDSS